MANTGLLAPYPRSLFEKSSAKTFLIAEFARTKCAFEAQHHGYALAKHTHKQVGARIARQLKAQTI